MAARVYIIAGTHHQAQHRAHELRLSGHEWRYVSTARDIQGLRATMVSFVFGEWWWSHPMIDQIADVLRREEQIYGIKILPR